MANGTNPEAMTIGTDHAVPPGLAEAARKLAHASVLVIGDVMLDRSVFGAVERVSPEAPVPVMTEERETASPGGAGNVVRNLTALGAAVAFIALVGDDQAGSELTGLIGGQAGVEPWLLVQGSRTTTVKTRFIARGQQILRTDREQVAPIHPKLADRLVRIAGDAMAATDIVVLSDYRKGLLTAGVPERLIAAARHAGRRVIADPNGADLSQYAGADLVTLNRQELAEATGLPVADDEAVVAAMAALRTRHGFATVLTTRGSDGMTLLHGVAGDKAEAVHIDAEATDVFDVSGAGDTVIAALAASLAAGLDQPTAMRIANTAAGIVVGKIGTAVARQIDLAAALTPASSALRKIVSAETAVEHMERWRHSSLHVGFTNGVFDLLHPGHVHLLEQARAACDRLVVGVNSDASTRRLKGDDRPVQPEAARAAVLASLASVDLVCIFDEDTPAALIAMLRPVVLVKGADYAIDQVVGADMVRGDGGRVILARLLPGHSTSATVARLRAVT
jgi:D-beta-D-heptose 7-phosphate kinase/D-beta-D-heptose 1-phosphate adenosyltransferase